MPRVTHKKDERKLLPHLYGHPWYDWSYEFFHDMSRNAFLTAPNQVGKSSALIKKVIHFATEPKIWKKVWNKKPTQFWYLYPSLTQATTEFHEKWVKENLPSGKMKTSEKYGWSEVYGAQKNISAIHFKNGVSIYFKSYMQSVSSLQTSTVYFIACDEELPVKYWTELTMRRDAVDGLFNLVFTATLSQRFWFEVMELRGKENERFPDAYKRSVSLYECQEYKSGKKAPWTLEKIKRRESECESKEEILVRVNGRFRPYKTGIYSNFDDKKNVIEKKFIVPKGWHKVIGAYNPKDSSGCAVCALAVSKDRQKCVIYYANKINKTTVETIAQYRAELGSVPAKFVNAEASDFHAIAQSGGEYFLETKMPRDGAKELVNTLFYTKILEVSKFDNCNDLTLQLQTIQEENLSDFKDFELIGALVCALSNMNFDFEEIINGIRKKIDPYKDMDPRERMYKGIDKPVHDTDSCEIEFQEFDELISV